MSINLFQIWNHFCRDSNLVPPGITTLFDTRLEYSGLEEGFGKISKFVLIISEYNWFQERDIFKSKLCWWEIKFGTHRYQNSYLADTRYQSVPKIFNLAVTRFPSVLKNFKSAVTNRYPKFLIWPVPIGTQKNFFGWKNWDLQTIMRFYRIS